MVLIHKRGIIREVSRSRVQPPPSSLSSQLSCLGLSPDELHLPNSFSAKHCSGQMCCLSFATLDAVWAGRAKLLRGLLPYMSLSHIHWCPTDRARRSLLDSEGCQGQSSHFQRLQPLSLNGRTYPARKIQARPWRSCWDLFFFCFASAPKHLVLRSQSVTVTRKRDVVWGGKHGKKRREAHLFCSAGHLGLLLLDCVSLCRVLNVTYI